MKFEIAAALAATLLATSAFAQTHRVRAEIDDVLTLERSSTMQTACKARPFVTSLRKAAAAGPTRRKHQFRGHVIYVRLLVALGSAGAANDREETMPVVDPRIAGKPVPRVSKETMEHECVARVKNVKALDVAFLDQRIPRYERDIINMVGMGVTENAALKPNVKESAVGFSVTYVRAKTGRGAALHRHATEEVFIPVKGRWQVFWLEGDEERTVDLDEGDVLNVPIGIYRGFRSLTDAPDALLMAIIGGPDAGKVDWHPSVLEEARKTGLTVDEEGTLIIEKPAA
jgi:mannose-6-phosphate isomerase-like protein (cupin superfamily)